MEDVKIACISRFPPPSRLSLNAKVAETAMALMEGADEIDIVISVGKFLAGDYEEGGDTRTQSNLQRAPHEGNPRNRSFEDGFEHQKKASILSMYSGADFIKTSTGKQQPAACRGRTGYVPCHHEITS